VEVLAVIATIAGAMVASADVRAISRAKLGRSSALGFGLALSAMALLGAFVFGVSYYRDSLGWLGPIFLARGFATVVLLAHVLAADRRRRIVEPRKVGAIIVLLALVDTGGYVCFNLGVRHAATAIVAAASAPYAVVPIVMGVWLFHERPTLVQWLGVALVVVGVVILGAVA
jgi:drug/metabolite transporter (DMT)-like permease